MKRVPTIAITVIRDGKRVTPQIGKAFDFEKEEIEAVTKQLPTAFRKPVNEDPDPKTAPTEKNGATATEPPKKSAAKKAAEKDSAASEATGNVQGKVGETGGASGSDADEDDDI